MKSYLVTEKQFNRIVESESSEIHFDDGKMIRLIQNYLDNIIKPSTNLVCKALIIRYEEDDDYYIRVWVNQNEKYTQDDLDDLVDTIWNSVYDMFGVSTAIHRVKGDC